MKICFVADGRHINTLSWVRHLSRVLGHEVHVASFSDPPSSPEPVAFHTLGTRLNTFSRYILYIPRLKRLLDKLQPDLLVGYRITSYGFMAAATRFHPLVLAAQSHRLYKGSSLKAHFARYAIRRADLVHAWGPHIAATLIEFGADPSKILTLPRGIDTTVFAPPREPLPSRRQCLLMTTRGLNPDYNFDQILGALEILKSRERAFRYMICGDGAYRDRLTRAVCAAGLGPYVELVGHLSHEELASRLQAADIYISTVAWDGVSTSLLEAMACGVFPIVTDNVANRIWIQDGVNGYLVPYGDPQTLAERLLAAMDSPELRASARPINRQLVHSRASINTNMMQFEACWARLLGVHQHASAT